MLHTCAACLLTAATGVFAAPPASRPAEERYWKKDAVATRQEFDAFISLQDGQPAGPGDWEMQLSSGWASFSRRSDPVLLEPALKYTPHRYSDAGAEFLENAQLSLRMPLETGNGRIDGNGDLTFGWQERWIAEDVTGCTTFVPTISTLAEVRMPTGDRSNGADGTLTAIVAKDAGSGTTYLNAWVRTANGDNLEQLRHFQWGVKTGYKWRVADRTAVIGGWSHESNRERGRANLNVLELAMEFRTKHHLAFGPGIFAGLDDHAETPNFGAGFRLIYLFNARNPPEE